jgi:flagellar motor switch protein FliM
MQKRNMKKTLSQKEIDAIVAAGHRSEDNDQRAIQLCNFHDAGQMSERHARFITALFEAFARSASNSLGAYFK